MLKRLGLGGTATFTPTDKVCFSNVSVKDIQKTLFRF